MEIISALFVVLAGVLFFIGWMTVGSILNGYVLSKLWAWFLVPTFGFPELSIPVAIGIALIAGYITYHDVDVESPKRDGGEAFSRALGTTIGRPLFVLLFGYVVKSFI